MLLPCADPMPNPDAQQVLTVIRRHLADGADRILIKPIGRALDVGDDYHVRAVIEAPGFAELAAAVGDDRLTKAIEAYLARDKSPLRPQHRGAGGFSGSIDETRRRLAAGKTPPEDFNGSLGPPDTPTDALPGTAAKVDVMAERYKARRNLHHPDDARRPGV